MRETLAEDDFIANEDKTEETIINRLKDKNDKEKKTKNEKNEKTRKSYWML